VTVGTGTPPARAVTGRVYLTEPTGSETWVTLELGGERLMGRAAADAVLGTREAAWASWEPEKVMLFDARTEERIELG